MRLYISLLFIFTGIVFVIPDFIKTDFYTERYQKIRKSEAVKIPVDLSKKGGCSGIFKQRFATEHGKQLRILTEPMKKL